MKKTYVAIALAVATMSAFGFAVNNQKPSTEKETTQVMVKVGAEKSGFVETISL